MGKHMGNIGKATSRFGRALLLKALSLAIVCTGLPALADGNRDCTEMKNAQDSLSRLTLGLSTGRTSSVKSDYFDANLAVLKLRVLAKAQRCGMSLSENEDLVVIHYAQTSNTEQFQFVKAGILSGDFERELVSWSQLRDGTPLHAAHFSPSGYVDFLN